MKPSHTPMSFGPGLMETDLEVPSRKSERGHKGGSLLLLVLDVNSNALVKSHQTTHLMSQYPRLGRMRLHRLASCQDELSSSALGERSSTDLGRHRGRPCITAATLQHSQPRCDYTGVSSIVNVRSNYSAAVFLSSDEKAMWSTDSGWVLSRVSDSSLSTKVTLTSKPGQERRKVVEDQRHCCPYTSSNQVG